MSCSCAVMSRRARYSKWDAGREEETRLLPYVTHAPRVKTQRWRDELTQRARARKTNPQTNRARPPQPTDPQTNQGGREGGRGWAHQEEKEETAGHLEPKSIREDRRAASAHEHTRENARTRRAPQAQPPANKHATPPQPGSMERHEKRSSLILEPLRILSPTAAPRSYGRCHHLLHNCSRVFPVQGY